jgi:hypothetical protein
VPRTAGSGRAAQLYCVGEQEQQEHHGQWFSKVQIIHTVDAGQIMMVQCPRSRLDLLEFLGKEVEWQCLNMTMQWL